MASVDPDPSPKRGAVTFDALMHIQDDVAVIQGEWHTVMLRRR